MVTVIGSGTSIRRTVLYNENKVKNGFAQCIMAANYPLDLEVMDSRHRLNMLLKTASLNPDVKRNSIHISMNFAPGEQLSDQKLKDIATEYMEQIGFKDQPYLVYRHDDAAHPHIHIATIKIRPDGTRIDTQNIGRNKSEPARKAIEIKYGLVRAEEQKRQSFMLQPVNVQRVKYGEQPTRNAINNVLQAVLSGYKYTSLPELNAVLNQYNIIADRGGEGSRIRQHGGLVYHMLDADGKPVGVPVKASSFYNNPGIKFLEKQYLKNDVARHTHKTRVKNAIDLTLLRNPGSTLHDVAQRLKAEGIELVIRQNDEGFIYGLTYVDFRTKCVFNGSAIGKNYSAKGMLERLAGKKITIAGEKKTESIADTKQHLSAPADNGSSLPEINKTGNDHTLLDELTGYEYAQQSIPYGWKKRKKKGKKR